MGVKFQLCSMNKFLIYLYNIMSIVKNMILYISKFKRIDLKLNVPMTHTQTHIYIKTKGHRLLGEVMDMPLTLIMVMVSWMFAYVQNC